MAVSQVEMLKNPCRVTTWNNFEQARAQAENDPRDDAHNRLLSQ